MLIFLFHSKQSMQPRKMSQTFHYSNRIIKEVIHVSWNTWAKLYISSTINTDYILWNCRCLGYLLLAYETAQNCQVNQLFTADPKIHRNWNIYKEKFGSSKISEIVSIALWQPNLSNTKRYKFYLCFQCTCT